MKASCRRLPTSGLSRCARVGVCVAARGSTRNVTRTVLPPDDHHRDDNRWQRQQYQNRSLSVSAAEVEKFNAMHDDWWKPHKNPLISMNAIRVRYLREQIEARGLLSSDERDDDTTRRPPLASLRALDIGCGGGLLSESLARLGARVTGIDPSVDLVAAARAHADGAFDEDDSPTMVRPDYRDGLTAEDLVRQGSMNGAFDVVCILEVIEHVRQPASLLQAAADLLRPGGLLFVSTMNRTLKAYALTIVGAECVMGYLPRGTHDWNLYRSPGEIRALVETCGLRQMDTTGMVLRRPPILSFEWMLDPTDTDINWIGCYMKQ